MEKAGKCTKKEVHHGILGEEQLGEARLRTRFPKLLFPKDSVKNNKRRCSSKLHRPVRVK